MQTIRKIRHPNRDFTVPIVVAKIPIGVASQVQVEEALFMAVRNFKASLPPPAPIGGCYSTLNIIVSDCHMMAMVQPLQRPPIGPSSPVHLLLGMIKTKITYTHTHS